MVELVALRVARDKPLTLGLLAGLGIGTVGLAAEWAWSYAWWTIEWPASMLVEGVVCGFVAAVAGGVTRRVRRARAQLARRSLRGPCRASRCRPRSWRSSPSSRTPRRSRRGDPVRAQVTLTDVKPPPEREVDVRRRARPGGRRRRRPLVRDHRVAGQGGPLPRRAARGGLARRLPQHRAGARSTATGSRRCACTRASRSRAWPSTSPRTRRSRSRACPAEPAFTRSFKRDKELSSASRSPASRACSSLGAYLIVLLIFIGLYGAMGWGLALMQQRLGYARSAGVRAAGPRASGARCRPMPAIP